MNPPSQPSNVTVAANNAAPGTSFVAPNVGTYVPPGQTATSTQTAPTIASASQTPLNSSTLAPATPLSLPSVTSSTANAYQNTLNTSQGALLGLTGGSAGSAEQDYNSQKEQITGQINTLLGEGADQAAQEKAAGTPQLQSAANTLNNQYLTAQSTFNNQYSAILNDSSMSTDQQARAITSLQQKNGLQLSNIGIQASLASNDYTNAETIIQHSIQLKYAPLQDAIQYGMQFLSQNKDILTQQEQDDFTAKLQVQQQTYDQSTYYSKLNASANMQMIQDATANKAPTDVINSMQKLIASGADAGQVAAAGGEYLSKGNYSYQFNPSTGQFSLINANTGLTSDGSPVNSGAAAYHADDPSSATHVTAPTGGLYDFSSYATDPQYGVKINAGVSTIQSKVGQITSPALMQAAISTLAPTSTLDGTMAYNAATAAGMDPTVFAAQLQQESLSGTSPVATKDNNFTGITYTGSPQQIAAGITQGSARSDAEGGFYAKFATPQDGLNYGAKVSASDYMKPPTANTPGQTPTIQQNISSINSIKLSLPSNISGAIHYINSTGDGYMNMDQVQDLPGFPPGSGKTQALAYAKQFNLTPITGDEVSAVQDYDTAMQQINTLQNQWNKVAPGGYWSRATDAGLDPFSVAFSTQRGQDLSQYNSNAAAALSTFNTITGSKKLSTFSTDLSQNALPVTPRRGALFIGAVGDTLDEGNAKLDNLRNDLNASLKSIDGTFQGAPLSSELPKDPLPKAGDTATIGAYTVKYNADGSATILNKN